MTPFVPFELERWQSVWEHRVSVNLSESGVHPLSIGELLDLSGGDLAALAELRMSYNQGDGSDELRSAIAALYPGATEANITVTLGSSEANFIACWTVIEPGDHVAILMPAYKQTWGLAKNFGADVSTFALSFASGWEPDPDEIARAITDRTKLVIVTNPNNPTGHVLSDTARAAIVERAQAVGAWLLADEVYQGAERDGRTTPSFWGTYERVIANNGLSKAYGLPGLRIGWLVTPQDFKQEVIRRHDYAVICPSPASDYLARQALAVRERILERTRGILRENYPVLDRWLQSFNGLFEWHPPECGAICFVRYRHPLTALDLVERIRSEQDMLLVPGEHFDMPGHLRLGFGNEREELETALEQLRPAIGNLLGD